MSEQRIQLNSLIPKLPKKLIDARKSKPSVEADRASEDAPPEQIHAKAERWARSSGLQRPTK